MECKSFMLLALPRPVIEKDPDAAIEIFYVVAYTAAVFINTVIDLVVVLLMAKGYTMNLALQGQHSADSAMSVKAIAENPSMQMALYIKYSEYLFPSCLLVPFLCNRWPRSPSSACNLDHHVD